MAQLTYHKAKPYFSSLTNAITPPTMLRFRKAFALAEEPRSTSTFISCILPAKSKSSFNRNAEISLYPKEEL